MTAKNPLNLKANAASNARKNAIHHHAPWRILVVDDEADIHVLTRLILSKITFKQRPIELLHAYSASEARLLLTAEKNIAVILLDVVMETHDAGLRLVKVIRDELQDVNVRIILRTGQPGQAPEEQVVIDYDINDYKAKNELTAQKLFTSIIAALRAYETIMSLNKTRLGLEKILHSSDSLYKVQSMQEFASGVLTQLSLFLGCQPEGVICIEEALNVSPPITSCHNLNIVAATDEFECFLTCTNQQTCQHHDVKLLINKTLAEKKSQFSDRYTAFYLDAKDNKASIVLICSASIIDDADRNLLAVFTSKISIALANAIHYQKMVSFEQASIIDFLTGLYNRRHLLRLGSLLLTNANRHTLPFIVVMLDIDFFKRINDSYGHDAGDMVLQEVSLLLNEHFKRHTDIIARYGGEEFCLLLSGISSKQAFEMLNQFRLSLESLTLNIGDEPLRITISIGATTHLQNDLDSMIVEADRLLYRAKLAGRNRVMLV